MKMKGKRNATTKNVRAFLIDVFDATKNKSLVLGDIVFKSNGVALHRKHKIANNYGPTRLVRLGILEEVIIDKVKYFRRILPDFANESELRLLADKLHASVYEQKRKSNIQMREKALAETKTEQKQINFENDTVTVLKEEDDYPTLLDHFKETVDQLNLEKADLEMKLEDANKSKLELRNKITRLEATLRRKDDAFETMMNAINDGAKVIIEQKDMYYSERIAKNEE